MAVLKIKNLCVDAPQPGGSTVRIVDNVNLEVRKGEVHALIGESGSGKTTIALSSLAYCRPGLKFGGGEVVLNGKNLLALDRQEMRSIRGHRVTYLAQSAAATFNPAMTIGEQVTESAIIHGLFSKKEAGRRAVELFQALELPDPDRLGFRYPHQVSGGQLQRLMAAMALCPQPDILVLDEPTTALDVTTQIEVLKAIKKVISEEQTAALYVSHDLAVVAQIANQITVLYRGRVQEHGTVDQIVNHPVHEYTRRLMLAARSSLSSGPKHSPDNRNSEQAVIEVKDVTAGYGHNIFSSGQPKVTVLQNVSMKVGRARVVGVVGESGCGKSTLARVIAGLLPASRGQIFLDDQQLAPVLKKRSLEQLRRIQIVFQMADTALNPRQKIKDILARPLEFYFGWRGEKKRQRVVELLQMVELPEEFADRFPPELSGGQKQRINLARALAADPHVLLCDEVTSSLDTIVAANIIQLLTRLRQNTGVSFVFISHDLSTVASFSDEIVVLYAGRVLEQGPVQRVLSPPFHPYTRLLISSLPELRIGWLDEVINARDIQTGIGLSPEINTKGCPFFPRCFQRIPGTCDKEAAPIQKITESHFISCHRSLYP